MRKFLQNWKQLLSVQAGGAICLPVIMIGQAIGAMFGFIPALICVGSGNLFLMGAGILTSIMSVKKRKPTSEVASDYFGKKEGRFFSSLLSFSMAGWFGIQLNFISSGVSHMLSIFHLSIAVNPIILNIGLGVLITFGALFGIKGIRILSALTMPLLIGVLIFAFFSAPLSMIALAPTAAAISFQSISMVIGGGIAQVIDFPTYFQHAKSRGDGIIASSLLFGLALPFIECVGVCLGVCFPHSSLLTGLLAGGGMFAGFVICLFLIFAGWTTNNTNIYSAAVNSKKVFPSVSYKKRILIFGLLGTSLSAAGLLSHLSAVLTIMGIILASMGAVTLASFLMDRFLKAEINRKGQIANSISFALGSAVGILTFFGVFTLTHLPVLDAFAAAAAAAAGLRFINNKKNKLKEIGYETN